MLVTFVVSLSAPPRTLTGPFMARMLNTSFARVAVQRRDAADAGLVDIDGVRAVLPVHKEHVGHVIDVDDIRARASVENRVFLERARRRAMRGR